MDAPGSCEMIADAAELPLPQAFALSSMHASFPISGWFEQRISPVYIRSSASKCTRTATTPQLYTSLEESPGADMRRPICSIITQRRGCALRASCSLRMHASVNYALWL